MATLDSVNLYGNTYSITDANVYNLIADKYSSDSTYNIGDYCIYDYKLYKCNTQISTGEDFDSTKWDQTTIMNELKN